MLYIKTSQQFELIEYRQYLGNDIHPINYVNTVVWVKATGNELEYIYQHFKNFPRRRESTGNSQIWHGDFAKFVCANW